MAKVTNSVKSFDCAVKAGAEALITVEIGDGQTGSATVYLDQKFIATGAEIVRASLGDTVIGKVAKVTTVVVDTNPNAHDRADVAVTIDTNPKSKSKEFDDYTTMDAGGTAVFVTLITFVEAKKS